MLLHVLDTNFRTFHQMNNTIVRTESYIIIIPCFRFVYWTEELWIVTRLKTIGVNIHYPPLRLYVYWSRDLIPFSAIKTARILVNFMEQIFFNQRNMIFVFVVSNYSSRVSFFSNYSRDVWYSRHNLLQVLPPSMFI